MTCKVLVCRVGEDPKVEEVEDPYQFCLRSLFKGGFVEAKLIQISDKSRVVVYWDEEARMRKLPFNRNVPVRAKAPNVKPDFVIDTRDGPPEMYAQPGELGYFPVLGNFLFTKADSNGNHISLSDEEIQALMPYLALCENCHKESPAYPGARYCGAGCSQEAEMKK